MDTRQKIHPANALAKLVRAAQGRGETCRLAIGYFDPILASHALRLRRLRDGAELLVVLVESLGDPLLPAQARAELVAGLASVDYVVISGKDKAEVLRAFDESEVYNETDADARDTEDLVLRIHERHRS